MKLPISARLLACCSYIRQGERIADVGCDHGYLSIYLLTHGIIRSAIASDLRKQPLQRAEENSIRYGVRDRMEFYLSDGVQKIPRDFDTLVCAGMGGDNMISILESAPWLKNEKYRLILQCQTRTPMLRHFLSSRGWTIHRESILRDGKFLYTVMEVCWIGLASPLSPGECFFSPALRADGSPETGEYFRWVLKKMHLLVDSRGENADPFWRAALDELEADPTLKKRKEICHDNCE